MIAKQKEPTLESTKPHRRHLALRAALGAAGVVAVAMIGLVALLQPRATLSVIDANSGDPITGATITLGNVTYTAEADGRVTLRTFLNGATEITVAREAYESATTSLAFQYGQTVVESIELMPAKSAVQRTVTVVDAIAETPLASAKVVVGEFELVADDQGAIDLVTAEDAEVTVRAAGYRDLIRTANELDDRVALVPVGEIVFVSNRDHGYKGLYRTAYDGSSTAPLVERSGGETEDTNPVRSPDGSLVAFSSTRGQVKGQYGDVVTQPYLVRADGSGLKRLSEGQNPNGLKWSPSGRFLYWVEIPQGGNDSLKRYSVSTGQVVTVASFPAIYSDFILSNDRMRIAFQGQSESDSGSASLFVADADGANLKSTGGWVSTFSFNRDGNVEFTRWEGGRHDYVLFADSGVVQEEQRSTDDDDEDRTYVTSPNGALRAFIDTRDGKSDLFFLNRSGEESQLTKLGTVSGALTPYWVNNGAYLVFAVQDDAESALYITSPNGGTAKKVTDATLEYGYY